MTRELPRAKTKGSKMKKVMMMILVGILVLPSMAMARQKHRKRIAHGIKSGELTKGEAKSLRRGQKRISNMREAANEDGEVTRSERRKLRRAQKRQSKRIYNKKHNDRSRGDAEEVSE